MSRQICMHKSVNIKLIVFRNMISLQFILIIIIAGITRRKRLAE